MKQFHYVYLTTNLINGKQYVGDHSTNNLNDSYLGSGKLLNIDIKQYGKQNFKKEILEQFSIKQEAFKNQIKYINKLNTLVPNGYNLSPTGGTFPCGEHSEESKIKMSQLKKGKPSFNKGKTYEELFGEERAKDIKNKQSIKRSGKIRGSNQKRYKLSTETKTKMSISGKLKIFTTEHKKHLSEASKGKPKFKKKLK